MLSGDLCRELSPRKKIQKDVRLGSGVLITPLGVLLTCFFLSRQQVGRDALHGGRADVLQVERTRGDEIGTHVEPRG